MDQRSIVSKTFCFKKKLSANEFGTQDIVSNRFRENNDVAGTGNLTELQLRIYYHRWGGVTVDEMQYKAKLSQLGHGQGLRLS